jgi:hypothetical protein
MSFWKNPVETQHGAGDKQVPYGMTFSTQHSAQSEQDASGMTGCFYPRLSVSSAVSVF